MRFFNIGLTTLLACSLAVAVFGQGKGQGQGQGQGKGQSKGKDAGVAAASSSPRGVDVNMRFGTDATRIITGYYRPLVGSLPPGLEKKVARGGTLPPGWQKKVQPFPADLERRLGAAPAGYRRVVSGQVALLIQDATNVVADVIELMR